MANRDGFPTCENCGNPIRNRDDEQPDLCIDCRREERGDEPKATRTSAPRKSTAKRRR